MGDYKGRPFRSHMTMTLETSGGFAGLGGAGGPIEIDTDRIDLHLASEIESLVDSMGFFDLPPIEPPALGTADFETHVITVRDGERTHSIEFSDPIHNRDLQRLVSAIRIARSSMQ